MKRNTLTTAVLAGLTGVAGMAGVANAVNVNPDGLGQVLLYPYYSARGGNDTLVSIVNTSDQGKAVKIRFIEALNSREVLDFNIYLSAFDVWVGGVTETDAGGGKIRTADTTCTVPYFVGEAEDGVGERDFLDFQYASEPVDTTGDGNEDYPGTIDGGPQGIERTASGYIEVIEMGTIADETEVSDALEHVDGVPPNCDLLVNLWREPAAGTTPAEGELGYWNEDPVWGFDTETGASGGIFGSASIIHADEGTMYSYNATAIDGFWVSGTSFHTNPGSLLPALTTGDRNDSNVFIAGTVYNQNWPAGPFALNATLTLAQLMNEYAIESALDASTEWVLTFPTKRFHADDALGGPNEGALGGEAIAPFTDAWVGESDNEACEVLEFAFWDREEQQPEPTPAQPGGVDVSPPPPPQPGEPVPQFQLCREANVMRFVNGDSAPDATEIFKEPLRSGDFEHLSYTNFALPEGWDSGWVRFDFSTRASVPDNDGDSVIGLPVIGFSANRYINGTLEDETGAAVRANYGGTFQHRGTRFVPTSVE